MVDISPIAYALRTSSQFSATSVKLSHAQQLVAAALGYNTLAAFQASPLESGASTPAHIALDRERLAIRIHELSLPHQPDELIKLVHAAFVERLPHVQVHRSVEDLCDYISRRVHEDVLNNDRVITAMATTNGDGVDEVYVPVKLDLAGLPLPGETQEIEFHGKVRMGIDTERPYCGHVIELRVALTLERTGRASIAEPEYEVIDASVDYGWGDDSDRDFDGREMPKVSLAEALAEELGIEVDEADELVDVEPTVNDSNDGLVYGYFFDFKGHASPAVAKKILENRGSLLISVPAWFFDRVASSEID
jgi:hypothetical protein